MKADTVDLAAIFGKPIRYMVPLFQRPYVWNREEQWEPLWEDVRAVADRQLDDTPSNDAIPHFMGAVVLEQALVPSGMIESRSVIDGQQRLTTLQLLLGAARSVSAEHGVDQPRQMFERLLFNDAFLLKRDGDRLKVLPTERDRTAFRESMQDGAASATGNQRIHEAYRYFRSAISEWALEGGQDGLGDRLDALSTALWKRLIVVTIDLDPGDNAQMIFETLNARGTPLLAGDLIKNHLFQVATIEGADIDALYRDRWQSLDSDWWRDEVTRGRLRRPRLDYFLNHWLAMRTGNEVVSHDLFPSFKRFLAQSPESAEEVLADLERYAAVYESFEKEPAETDLGRFLYRLGVLEVTTAYPALLWLLGPEGIGDPVERKTALDAMESWLVRRLLTRMTTKNYNVVFLALLNAIRSASAAHPARGQDVVDFLAAQAGESQVWPTDEAVLASMRSLPLYTTVTRSRLRMVLEALEEASYTGLSEKVVLPHDLTIEHVLPQEWATHWPLPADEDPVIARTRRDAAKHTIGNLTLVTGRLNPKLSNGPWPEKRAALAQYSVLLISADLKQAETWDETAIAHRGEKLARTAVFLWRRPEAAISVAESAEPEASAATARSVEARSVPPLPDEEAFAEVLRRADAAGVGAELRLIITVSRELGLHLRPYRNSVMVSPPSDERADLMTIWPQAQGDGSFRIWVSPKAFARFFPVAGLEAARAELGSGEGPSVLGAADVDRLLASIRRIVGSGEAPAPAGSTAEPDDDDSDESVPPEIVWLIETRASAQLAPIATRFAAAALAMDGVQLRLQGGKGEPWYFQVRHPRFRQVVSYVHPRPSELHIEYRLPSDHETYGVAESRDNFYGVAFKAKEAADLEIALRLLRDALARPE